eukprot:3491598-Amphidinium_carterae.2
MEHRKAPAVYNYRVVIVIIVTIIASGQVAITAKNLLTKPLDKLPGTISDSAHRLCYHGRNVYSVGRDLSSHCSLSEHWSLHCSSYFGHTFAVDCSIGTCLNHTWLCSTTHYRPLWLFVGWG